MGGDVCRWVTRGTIGEGADAHIREFVFQQGRDLVDELKIAPRQAAIASLGWGRAGRRIGFVRSLTPFALAVVAGVALPDEEHVRAGFGPHPFAQRLGRDAHDIRMCQAQFQVACGYPLALVQGKVLGMLGSVELGRHQLG